MVSSPAAHPNAAALGLGAEVPGASDCLFSDPFLELIDEEFKEKRDKKNVTRHRTSCAGENGGLLIWC